MLSTASVNLKVVDGDGRRQHPPLRRDERGGAARDGGGCQADALGAVAAG